MEQRFPKTDFARRFCCSGRLISTHKSSSHKAFSVFAVLYFLTELHPARVIREQKRSKNVPRIHLTDIVVQALSEHFPEVHFTVGWHDAVSMTSADLRLERTRGIYEGLMLAGLVLDPRISS